MTPECERFEYIFFFSVCLFQHIDAVIQSNLAALMRDTRSRCQGPTLAGVFWSVLMSAADLEMNTPCFPFCIKCRWPDVSDV